ncbi:hypothetical protein AA0229_0188 [Gluconobacter cerinus NRIC 0229]|nr:hypothetical protein AA0229_0188 [Gluconobacter cerinus NRIC 0229]
MTVIPEAALTEAPAKKTDVEQALLLEFPSLPDCYQKAFLAQDQSVSQPTQPEPPEERGASVAKTPDRHQNLPEGKDVQL